MKKKSGGVENPMLSAFQLMESETNIVDIMDEMNLEFDTVIDYQTKFNQMKELEFLMELMEKEASIKAVQPIESRFNWLQEKVELQQVNVKL